MNEQKSKKATTNPSKIKAMMERLKTDDMFYKGNRTGAILMPVSKEMGEAIKDSRDSRKSGRDCNN